MNGRLAFLALAATAVVLLTGCSSEVTQENISITPGQTGTFSNGDTTVTVEGSSSASQSDEANFLADVRGALPSDSAVLTATDQQLIAAGRALCAELDGGVDVTQVHVAVGGAKLVPGADSTAIAKAADSFLCR